VQITFLVSTVCHDFLRWSTESKQAGQLRTSVLLSPTVHSGRKKHLIILYVRTLPTSHANKMDQSQPHAEELWPKLVVPREHPRAFLAKEVSNIWRTTPWTRYLWDLSTLRKSLCSCKVALWKSWPWSVSTHGKTPFKPWQNPLKTTPISPDFRDTSRSLGLLVRPDDNPQCPGLEMLMRQLNH
jgi:hypothetical protein